MTRDFLILNNSLTIALHRTPPILFDVESRKQYFKEVLDGYKSTSQNFPYLTILSEYILHVHIKNNAVM